MEKYECKDLKLITAIGEDEIDLSSFILEFPLYIGNKENGTIICYFTKDNCSKINIDVKSNFSNPVFMKTDLICLKEFDINLLKDKEVKTYDASKLIESILVKSDIRLKLVRYNLENIGKDIGKDVKNIGLMFKLLNINSLDLDYLSKISDNEEINKHLEITKNLITETKHLFKKLKEKGVVNV